MTKHHAVAFTLVAVVAIIGLSINFFGSPFTGMGTSRTKYLNSAVGQGEQSAISAAETCYPIKQRFNSYDICCSDPCLKECEQMRTNDIQVCQASCRNTCVKIVTSIYLKRRPGTTDFSNKPLQNNKDYVILDK